ncbi:MAG TPA: spore germination protein [Clostridiaceae bacterium]|nr:spore germination protein [Clostridiaceae bacterium]
MAGLLQTLKNFLAYKEPLDTEEGFELLEGEYEGAEHEKNEKPTSKSNIDQSKAIEKNTSSPFKAAKWNEYRKKENKNQLPMQDGLVFSELKANLENIKQEFNMPKNEDIVIREFTVGMNKKAFIVFVDGMADKIVINDFILRQLMNLEHFKGYKNGCPVDYVMNHVLSINNVEKVKEYKKIISQILNGVTALFIDGCEEALLIESRGYEKRNIDKPSTESVVMGSQEGFTENLRTNITLIRRIIKNKDLITEIQPVGKTSNSNCAIMYLEGIANPELVKEVKRRIKSINIDFVTGDGMIEQFIEDKPFQIIPQVLNTERPDRAASFIMEGQVVIIGEGVPFVNVVPVTFFAMFHASEDSFLRWPFGTAIRLIRILGLFFATLLPALYVSLILYHQEMIPTDLLVAFATARENVPFPTIIEVLILEISFELIREAGVRVPGIIGPTLGIIGALILGQAAVAANLVSPVLIIVVAVTGLGNFAIPSYSLATGIRLIRFGLILAGAFLGFYGVAAVLFIVGCFVCNMKSFGVPFLSPISPVTKKNPDIIARAPNFKQKKRPDYLNTPNQKRTSDR